MSFHEKSLWLSLAALVLVFAGYTGFAGAGFLAALDGDVSAAQAGRFIAATVWLVVIMVAGHVALALHDRRATADERDRAIAAQGRRDGAFVLAVGVFCTLCVAVLTHGNARMAHVLLAFWVLAQAVEYLSQLLRYRFAG